MPLVDSLVHSNRDSVTGAHGPFAKRDPTLHCLSKRFGEAALVIRVGKLKPRPYLLLLEYTGFVERVPKPQERPQDSFWFDTQLARRMRPHEFLRSGRLSGWRAEVLVPPPRKVRGPTRVRSSVVGRIGQIDRESIKQGTHRPLRLPVQAQRLDWLGRVSIHID
jgi:hypothetical protein